ncbi:MAG: family 2 glycosyl transferase [Candidatus Moranbacteria bacterium GW2011_GWD2_37_9]|uniref:Family 2 glycosyl transferase n=1 Tax=Candidatus Nomurabacteria bacterium GW2011_GWE1_35_16 TaxID=1618761 RepID=A0A0G0DSN2_9BACT|nr:MAG: family 2 glycosyl transferase [Candidatus Nomurabacteria bacterium GW2011_GWE1_35_16]KKQ47584.1 MAG: family 2 glycosyl transferase [Candidatus Moranbacteria bacterium GW2011_GWD2_37_9]
MLNNKTIAVVVPSYNEEKQIGIVIESMPDFVDRIVIVNDKSKDSTAKIVEEYIKNDNVEVRDLNHRKKIVPNRYNYAELVAEKMEKDENCLYTPSEIYNKDPKRSRIILINHLKNGSVGAAIATGYKWCLDNNIDCTAVMAGDGQMDPDELEAICMPVIDGEVDYVKGNRLKHRSASFVIPKIRFFGNSVLSLMTKIASGYWQVSDTQTGYTSISLEALRGIKLYDIYHSYGCPNDILVKLNIANFTIREIPIKPIYNVGEKSKMQIFKVIPRVSWLLFKLFWLRLYKKYLLRDFHPLFLLYHLSFTLLLINIPYLVAVFSDVFLGNKVSTNSLMAFIFLSIIGFQSLFFAMWMDMMDNQRLQK